MSKSQSKFADVAQTLIDKIRNDLPSLGEFKPTVFVVKADGNHEVLRIQDVADLVIPAEDIDEGNIPSLDKLMSKFRILIQDHKDAYEGECLGILFVGMGKVKAVKAAKLTPEVLKQVEDGALNPAELDDAEVVTAAGLSFNGTSITGDDSIMQVYPCTVDSDGNIVNVSAKALDLDSMCEPPTPPAEGRFNFGSN